MPPGGPTPGVFFTRWVRHVVAPAFVFLAGTAAFLHGRRLGDRRALASFLAIRGIWQVGPGGPPLFVLFVLVPWAS